MADRPRLLLALALLVALVPGLARAEDQPVASAPIPPATSPPSPYVVPSHPALPPPIPKLGEGPATSKERHRSASEPHIRYPNTRRASRHGRREPRHHFAARNEAQPPALPKPQPRRRHYARNLPSDDWEDLPRAPPPRYGYYPGPSWPRGPEPW